MHSRKRQRVDWRSPRSSPSSIRIPQFDGSPDESEDKRTNLAGANTPWATFIKPRFCSLFTQKQQQQQQQQQLQKEKQKKEKEKPRRQEKQKAFSHRIQSLRDKIAKTKQPTKKPLLDDIECTPTPNSKISSIPPIIPPTPPPPPTTHTKQATTAFATVHNERVTTTTTTTSTTKTSRKKVSWGSPLVIEEEKRGVEVQAANPTSTNPTRADNKRVVEPSSLNDTASASGLVVPATPSQSEERAFVVPPTPASQVVPATPDPTLVKKQTFDSFVFQQVLRNRVSVLLLQ